MPFQLRKEFPLLTGCTGKGIGKLEGAHLDLVHYLVKEQTDLIPVLRGIIKPGGLGDPMTEII